MNDFRKYDMTQILGAGAYVLSRRSAVVYIGRTKSLLARLHAHRRARAGHLPRVLAGLAPGISFDSVQIIPCRVDELDSVFDAVCTEYGYTRQTEVA